MNEKTPRTFEEYNFQEFMKLKKENQELKDKNEALDSEMQLIKEECRFIKDLVKEALKNSRVEKDESLTHVYVEDRFIGLYVNDLETDNKLKTLEQLINLAKEK